MKLVIKLILLIIIIALGYFVVESIMEPVRFNKQKDIRSQMVINKLEDIRSAQIAYRALNGTYMGDWDTLINFIKEK
jgi:sensor domain CHASE-containing protein